MIKEGSKVKFHYKGKLESGEIFDSSNGKAPLEFEAGKRNIIPGLEKELIGMKTGDKKIIQVAPDDAYGKSMSELIREVPKGPMPPGIKLEKGTILYLRTPEGQPVLATVSDIKETSIVLDFNHPLAGKKLIFDVEVVDVS